MTAFSIANLRREVVDSAKEFGFSPALEARFGKEDLESERLSVVVEGSGKVHLDGEARDVGQWDAVRVSGPVLRSFEAGPDGLAILAFGEINPANDAEIVMPDA